MTTRGKFDAPLTLKGCQFKLGEYANVVKTLNATTAREKQSLQETKQRADSDKDNIAIQMLNGTMFVKQHVIHTQKDSEGHDVIPVNGHDYIIIGTPRIAEGIDDMILMFFGKYTEGGTTHYNLLMKWGIYCDDVLIWQDDFEVVKVTNIQYTHPEDNNDIWNEESRSVEVLEVSHDNEFNHGFDCSYIKERHLYRICTNKFIQPVAETYDDNFLVVLESREFVKSYNSATKTTTWTYLVKEGEKYLYHEWGRYWKIDYLHGCFFISHSIGIFKMTREIEESNDSTRKELFDVEVTTYFGYKIRKKKNDTSDIYYRWPITIILESVFSHDHINDPRAEYSDHRGELFGACQCVTHLDPDFYWGDMEHDPSEIAYMPTIWPNDANSEYYRDCDFKTAVFNSPINTTNGYQNINIYEFYAVCYGSLIRCRVAVFSDIDSGEYYKMQDLADWAQHESVYNDPTLRSQIAGYKWSHTTYDPINNLVLMMYDDVTNISWGKRVNHMVGYFLRTSVEPDYGQDGKIHKYYIDLITSPLLYADSVIDTVPTDALTFDEKTNKIFFITRFHGAFTLNGFILDNTINKYYVKAQDIVDITARGEKTMLLAKDEYHTNPVYKVYILNYDMLNEWLTKINQALN